MFQRFPLPSAAPTITLPRCFLVRLPRPSAVMDATVSEFGGFGSRHSGILGTDFRATLKTW